MMTKRQTKRQTMEDLKSRGSLEWFANFYSYDTATNEWILSIFYTIEETIFVKFMTEKPLTIVNFPVSGLIGRIGWCGYGVRFTDDCVNVNVYSNRDYYWEGEKGGTFPIVDVWRARGYPVLKQHKFLEKIK